MRTIVKVPMQTTDCQSVISTITDVLEPLKYTKLELRDITVWHKKDKYFAVSFQNKTAHLQGWLETHPSAANDGPLCTPQAYSMTSTLQEEISLHSLRSPFLRKKQLKLLSKLESAILEKNL